MRHGQIIPNDFDNSANPISVRMKAHIFNIRRLTVIPIHLLQLKNLKGNQQQVRLIFCKQLQLPPRTSLVLVGIPSGDSPRDH